jgi:hypothetical protein
MTKSTVTTCPHCGGALRVQALGRPKTLAGDQAPTFQSVASTWAGGDPEPEPEIVHKSFWASDGPTYAIAGLFAGGVVLTFGWAYELTHTGLVTAIVAISGGFGMHLLKLWWHKPPAPDAPKSAGVTIKIEERGTSENPRGLKLDSIEDPAITLEDLQSVARAISAGANFSRPALTVRAGISQSKYRKIKNEFERLNFVFTDRGNKTQLLRSGRAFCARLKARAEPLPYPTIPGLFTPCLGVRQQPTTNKQAQYLVGSRGY